MIFICEIQLMLAAGGLLNRASRRQPNAITAPVIHQDKQVEEIAIAAIAAVSARRILGPSVTCVH